ncbi:MAG: universal stress protein [Anaerolineales bacterium]|nr:MAG: universal stress protein [Anaerolineales bacterium]
MFDHILVPLDGSSLAECVLPHVVAVAHAFGSRVTLLQVLEQTRTPGATRSVDPLGWHIRKAEAEAYLEEVVGRLQEVDLRTENTLLEGQAVERIIEFAHDQNVGLILLSSHGRSGLSGWNVSSVVQKIILRAYVPVMIVRAYQPVTSDLTGLRYRRLLVPLDCSRRAECILPLATTLAGFHKSEVLLVHVVSRPQMPCRVPLTREDSELANRITERNRLEATTYLEQLQSWLDVDVQTRLLLSNNAIETLHDLVEQEEIDLAILSAHGYSGGTKWPYGSVAISFIAYGTTPLFIMQDLAPDEVKPTQAEVAAKEYKGH